MRVLRLILGLLVLTAAVPVLAQAEGEPDEREQRQESEHNPASDAPEPSIVGSWDVTLLELGNTAVELDEDVVFRLVFTEDGQMQRWVGDELERSGWYEMWVHTNKEDEQITQLYLYNDLDADGQLSDQERGARERMIWSIDECGLVLQSQTEVYGTEQRVPVVYATLTLLRSE